MLVNLEQVIILSSRFSPFSFLIFNDCLLDVNWNSPTLLTNDVAGINIHNEQWASFVSKAAGGGFSW